MTEEEVLVFPESLLEECGSFVGLTDQVDTYLPILLDPRHLRYLPRSQAEEDPSFKQLIPYVVLRSGESVYTYSRGKKGGETRLHDRLSIGVGGHICREDGSEGETAYEVGFARELREEVRIETAYTGAIVGLLYDPSTPVGTVHVGVVHLLDLEAPRVTAIDPALASARFRPLRELIELRADMETWSAFVLEHVLLRRERVSTREVPV